MDGLHPAAQMSAETQAICQRACAEMGQPPMRRRNCQRVARRRPPKTRTLTSSSQAPEVAQAAMERQAVEGWQPYTVDGRLRVEQPMVVAAGQR